MRFFETNPKEIDFFQSVSSLNLTFDHQIEDEIPYNLRSNNEEMTIVAEKSLAWKINPIPKTI